MPTRFLLAGLHFFGLAAVAAIAVALLAPLDAIRFLGVAALACAGTGFLVQLYTLERLDPQAFLELRVRFHASLHRIHAFGSRAARPYTGATHSSSSRSGG